MSTFNGVPSSGIPWEEDQVGLINYFFGMLKKTDHTLTYMVEMILRKSILFPPSSGVREKNRKG